MAKRQKVEAEKKKIRTPECRIAWPAVFEARAAQGSDKPKYSVTMLFRVKETPKSKERGEKVVDIQPLKDAVRAVIEQIFGTDKTKWPKLHLPFRSTTTEEDRAKKDMPGFDDGVVFVQATSDPRYNPRPGIVYAFEDPKTGKPKVLEVPTDFYGGVYALVTVNPYYWEFMGKHGVSFGLQNLQKLRDGERLSGKESAENDFEPIEGASQAEETQAAGVGAGAADPTGL